MGMEINTINVASFYIPTQHATRSMHFSRVGGVKDVFLGGEVITKSLLSKLILSGLFMTGSYPSSAKSREKVSSIITSHPSIEINNEKTFPNTFGTPGRQDNESKLEKTRARLVFGRFAWSALSQNRTTLAKTHLNA